MKKKIKKKIEWLTNWVIEHLFQVWILKYEKGVSVDFALFIWQAEWEFKVDISNRIAVIMEEKVKRGRSRRNTPEA